MTGYSVFRLFTRTSTLELVLKCLHLFNQALKLASQQLLRWLDCIDYFSKARKSRCIGLGKNRFSIHNDIKDPSFAGDQFCLNIQLVTQFLRQTGGSGFVVSHTAVVNFNFHNILLENRLRSNSPAAKCRPESRASLSISSLKRTKSVYSSYRP